MSPKLLSPAFAGTYVPSPEDSLSSPSHQGLSNIPPGYRRPRNLPPLGPVTTVLFWLLPISLFHFSILWGGSSFWFLQAGVIHSGLGSVLAYLLPMISSFRSAWLHPHAHVSPSTVLFWAWLAPLPREYFTAIQVYSCLKQSSCFRLTPNLVSSPAHFCTIQNITISLSLWLNIPESFLIALFSYFLYLIRCHVFLGSTI